MASFEPEWIDVTWGAGGSTAQKTLEICATAQKYCGLETMMHLTCTNMPRAEIDDALRQAKAAGIQNILALRGGTLSPHLAPDKRLALIFLSFLPGRPSPRRRVEEGYASGRATSFFVEEEVNYYYYYLYFVLLLLYY